MQDNTDSVISIRLLKWRGIYALKPYMPNFARLRQAKSLNQSIVSDTAWVYNFKRYLKNAEEIRSVITAAMNHFGCDYVFPIPPSRLDDQPNSMQKIFGSPITRIKSVDQRKYNHGKKIPDGNSKSYQVEKIEGNKTVLLLDDILRTGETMFHFRDFLVEMGYSVTMLAIGIYYRLKYETGDSLVIYSKPASTLQSLPNLLAVVDHLNGKGWKLSRSTAYKHNKEGKIRPREDGIFLIKDAEKYAANFLKRRDGTTSMGDLEGLQREKLEAETKKAKAQAEHWDLKTRIATGEYVERAAFEHELAARAAVFRSDLENFFRSQAGGMINLVDGDTVKASDLIEYMLEQMEIWLGRYAQEKAEFKTGEGIDANGTQ